MKSCLTIALLGKDFGWGGGVDFLRYLANGLLAKQQKYDLKIYLLLPVNNRIEDLNDILRVVKRSINGTLQRKRPWFALPAPAYQASVPDFFLHLQRGKIEIIYYANTSAGLLRCLKSIKADVALPVNGTLGRDYPIPWVGYASDFQHKYYPENFSSQECFSRDIHFATVFRDSSSAIVNSKAVKDDVFHFFPHTNTKVCSLPFSPNPLSEWFEELPFNIYDKYLLPNTYFLISNQFWVHKDHLTAFKALKSVDGYIVCTGSMEDYRRPGYMAIVRNFLVDNDLTDRVLLLGHIPKRDQIEIMKKSVAVLQPTLFEGGPGGGCIYDAVSLGVPAIISDIPVNREVEGKNIYFFKAGAHDELAEKMQYLLQTHVQRPTIDQLIMMGQANLEKLGDTLLEVVSYVV